MHGTLAPGQAEEAPIVAFERVSRRFSARGGAGVAALDEVSFSVARGEIFGFIGRSGAGKSTLLRMINGLERPDSGRVVVNGADVGRLEEAALVALRRRVGMVFQGFNLMSARNVRDNVALPLRLAGESKAAARARAEEAIDLVGLSEKADAYPAKLSGGQRQRAGIARALVSRPDLLLSDEATSALDPETTRSILALLRDINQRLGLTTVLITHEMEVIRAVADRVAVLDRGRVVEIGPVWRVFGRPQHETTRSLLADANASAPLALAGRRDEVVLALSFDGADERQPDLFAIAAALGPGARVLESEIEPLQGHPQGRLVVAAPREQLGDLEAARERLRRLTTAVDIFAEGEPANARQSV
jgi:D-methionine transport system ATP-binding protein